MIELAWAVLVVVLLVSFGNLWKDYKSARAAGTEAPIQVSEEQLAALEGAEVLLADGSETIRKVVELLLVDAGARLTCVADGKSAMDLLEDRSFDLVIVDVDVPERADSAHRSANIGFEVCEYAKRRNPGLPVLLLIGFLESFNEKMSKKCGAEEVLKKPFDTRELVEITSRLLHQHRG